jgi:putative Mg2+ transporter-C (MgtC) family protein
MEPILPPTGLLEVIARLLVATLAGGVIGVEREIHAKPAGVRTHALVALGSALVVISGTLLVAAPSEGEAVSRIIQGLLGGIGFLGAGTILQRTTGKEVHGLTTAASLWVVAIIGVSAGLGQWRITLAAAIIVLLVLLAEGPIARMLKSRQHDPDKPK